MKSSILQATLRGMIIPRQTPHQQICLLLGRAGVTQQRARRLACGVKLCWRLDFLVLLRQGKRTEKSSLPTGQTGMTQALHGETTINHARFLPVAPDNYRDGMAIKRKL